jgi:hypothetical protein
VCVCVPKASEKTVYVCLYRCVCVCVCVCVCIRIYMMHTPLEELEGLGFRV